MEAFTLSKHPALRCCFPSVENAHAASFHFVLFFLGLSYSCAICLQHWVAIQLPSGKKNAFVNGSEVWISLVDFGENEPLRNRLFMFNIFCVSTYHS